MTKRLTLKKHLASLEEIKNIINAMKNLSLMEISKASKFLSPQERLMETIQEVATDFFSFHTELAKQLFSASPQVYILIGSERGFCGSFNEMIIKQWRDSLTDKDILQTKTFIVGSKLAAKIPERSPTIKVITAPNATEEIQSVILTLMREVETTLQADGEIVNPANWAIIFNEETKSGFRQQVLRPLVALGKEKSPQFATAPLLYLEPQQFLLELIEQYLFAVLYQIFYQSFVTENQERLKHMESALDWMEKKNTQLKLHMNELRQEEITEEIEVIMLSVENLQHKLADD